MSSWCKQRNAEFVLGVDGSDIQIERAYEYSSKVVPVKSLGYLESVLDSVVSECSGDYIFRLDDDEFFSSTLSEWLSKDTFRHSLYHFPRANLWGDERHFIVNDGLYPDVQVRFSTKAQALGRDKIHCISPFGFGQYVQARILHYKFLVKSYEERREIAKTYELVRKGAGLGEFKRYSLPEDVFDNIEVMEK